MVPCSVVEVASRRAAVSSLAPIAFEISAPAAIIRPILTAMAKN